MLLTTSSDQQDHDRERYVRVLLRWRQPMCVAAMIVGLLGFYANLFGVSVTFRSGTGAGATTPMTLAAIILLCLALAGIDRRGRFYRFAPMWAMSAAMVALLPHGFEAVGLGEFQIRAIAGKLGVDTSCVILLLAIAAYCRYRFVSVGLLACFVAAAFTANSLIGQTYGLPYFSGDMALMTALALTFATIATLIVYLDRPIVRFMFISSAIGLRTRMMMGVGFFVPWVCGLLLYHWYGVPDRLFHVEATLISVIICVMLVVTLASGFVHEKADKRRRESEEKLAQMALHDPLTGLKNRAGLGLELAAAWDAFGRHEVPSAVMLIDLDHFKRINDTFGHDMGDNVLKAVSAALQPHLRHGEVVGRWGGEEFLCLLNNTNLQQLHLVAERLRLSLSAISALPQFANMQVPVSGSFGISAFAKDDHGYASAIKRADDALYAAKRAGRNRVIFDPGLRPITPSRPRARRSALTA